VVLFLDGLTAPRLGSGTKFLLRKIW
jgi:hypothetical protein